MTNTGFLSGRVPWICASILAAFHILAVVTTLVATRGQGEGPGLVIAILDFPLHTLLRALPNGNYILYKSTAAYIGFFSIAGTLMYAAIGYCFGVLLRVSVIGQRRVHERGPDGNVVVRRGSVAFRVAVAVLLAAGVGSWVYGAYWRARAEDAVVTLAARIADGQATGACASLQPELEAGFAVAPSDTIPLRIGYHEVRVSTANGKELSFDAYWRDGRWEITCP